MDVLVTGANRGIGQGLVDHYRAAGDHVIATARDGSADIGLDVTDSDQQARLAEMLVDQPIDLLICNAGVYLDKGIGIADYTAEIWAQTFAANVTGVYLTVRSVLPSLQRTGGKIAIMSSQMASHTRAPGGSYAYRASKAAVLSLGRNLAADLAGDGIAVGIYHPGWVQSDMGSDAADITVAESVAGLTTRFDHLSLATTGCFETWDGRTHAY
ncbi:MAG: SDR family NAD(P)-dependent oxidoreductase [Pseudomonadota bacterium]